VLDIDEGNIIERGRLQSGQMIGLDLKYGKVIKHKDIDEYLKDAQPYSRWLNSNMEYLQEYVDKVFDNFDGYKCDDLYQKQRFYNITHEIIDQIIEPMADDGKEPVGSMGDDTPISAFSKVQRSFNDFFKQKFAQVTTRQ
jgi:glutamate synthase (NADPH/NADH) large chain